MQITFSTFLLQLCIRVNKIVYQRQNLTRTKLTSMAMRDSEKNKQRIMRVALYDLLPFVQFKKREKHPWRSVNFSKKLTLHHGCFSRFLNCTNGTKPRNASHIVSIRHSLFTSIELRVEGV